MSESMEKHAEKLAHMLYSFIEDYHDICKHGGELENCLDKICKIGLKPIDDFDKYKASKE